MSVNHQSRGHFNRGKEKEREDVGHYIFEIDAGKEVTRAGQCVQGPLPCKTTAFYTCCGEIPPKWEKCRSLPLCEALQHTYMLDRRKGATIMESVQKDCCRVNTSLKRYC